MNNLCFKEKAYRVSHIDIFLIIIVIEALNTFNIGNMEGRVMKSRMDPLICVIYTLESKV